MHACVAGLQRQLWVLARYPQGLSGFVITRIIPYTTLPYPNLTLPYPQPYLGMGRIAGRTWVEV